jgi:hypothetical protein
MDIDEKSRSVFSNSIYSSVARDTLNEEVKYNQALYYDHDVQLRIKINTEFL